MHRTRVKICGTMRPEDARMASLAGADAVGMIFHPPSKRNIDIDRAWQIVAAAGAFVTPVGVFVDAATQDIIGTARGTGLRTIQLHGHERADQVCELGEEGFAVLKAIRVDATVESELQYWKSHGQAMRFISGIVLETGATNEVGGSGIGNDFDRIHACQQRGDFAGLPPLIVAGGLRPETVRGVVALLRPWAVDVSTGVEREVGMKDERLVRAFIDAARLGDAQGAP